MCLHQVHGMLQHAMNLMWAHANGLISASPWDLQIPWDPLTTAPFLFPIQHAYNLFDPIPGQLSHCILSYHWPVGQSQSVLVAFATWPGNKYLNCPGMMNEWSNRPLANTSCWLTPPNLEVLKAMLLLSGYRGNCKSYLEIFQIRLLVSCVTNSLLNNWVIWLRKLFHAL